MDDSGKIVFVASQLLPEILQDLIFFDNLCQLSLLALKTGLVGYIGSTG